MDTKHERDGLLSPYETDDRYTTYSDDEYFVANRGAEQSHFCLRMTRFCRQLREFLCVVLVGCCLSQIMCQCHIERVAHYAQRVCGCIMINGPLYIAALVIGFNATCDASEDTEFLELIMNPNVYLCIAGFVGFLGILCTARWPFALTKMSEGTAVSHCCHICWDISWCTVGTVLFAQMGSQCQGSEVGLMIISYIAIKWIFTGCRCMFIVAGCFATNDPVILESKEFAEELYGSFRFDERGQRVVL